MVRLLLRALALALSLLPFVSLGANAKPVVETAFVPDTTGSMAPLTADATRNLAPAPRQICLAIALEQCNARIARLHEPFKKRHHSNADRHQLTPTSSSDFFDRAAEPTPRAQIKQ
jgi:hypothetical protein